MFQRERERLHMDEKGTATSKGLLKSIGACLPGTSPAAKVIESTDMGLLQADEDYCTNKVKQLNQLASSF